MQELQVSADEEAEMPLFWRYITKNGVACKEMWCSYLRYHVAHLGNSTNNRLESSWQKIETLVDRDMELDETITSLIWWAIYKERQFTTEMSRVGQVFDTRQYDIARKLSAYYTIRSEENGRYVVASENTTCNVDTMSWSAYCMFGMTRKLPCRRIMYLRNVLQLPSLVPVVFC
ncbi:hypothetical protein PHMEG_00017739 [Phytophthora megakarya]|uniref:Uncharacterized protein n=1 Tax=Phytophthora megakarya TaxID=4795 RepID=A0A225VWK4_9STRA|nr:hypothetical protein PHMEG_00017739 [Phytophthora megakarya]